MCRETASSGTTRRVILQGSLGALLLLPFSSRGKAADVEPTAPETWRHFLDVFRPEALRLVREEGLSPASYVRRLSSEVVRVRDIPSGDLQPIPWMRPAMHFGILSPGRPFAVTEWRMEPGARQPCHDHPGASVCTLLLEGELLMENFELVGERREPGSADPLRLRRTRMERLLPGRTSVLTPVENNLHRLTAGPNGARGIDLNSLHSPGGRFGYIRLPDMPARDAGEADIFEGRWYDPSVATK